MQHNNIQNRSPTLFSLSHPSFEISVVRMMMVGDGSDANQRHTRIILIYLNLSKKSNNWAMTFRSGLYIAIIIITIYKCN